MSGPGLLEALAERALVVDGGLGTRLEERGADVSSELWSARVLADSPDEVLDVHRDYFAAGADVAITASYQVTYEGCARAGFDADQTTGLLRRSVELARRARDQAGHGWVAASVGPYGAMLADGSEYRGDLGLGLEELRDWHRERIRVLADAGADLIAFETMPSLVEVEAILAELAGTGTPAWISVTPLDTRLRSGEPLAEAFALAAAVDEVVAVGVNCCAPGEVLGAIEAAREVTMKPVVVYPNSGETWDAAARRWRGSPAFPTEAVRSWRAAGAGLIGGCCRTGPGHTTAISRALA
ncbi:homocysteine S-methyltransferase [Agromyces sp. ISL-38]|uniref:homocysteine S-methyltransferase n=1 Tax=Agromyces sp. ISL-38 TaxID=2819107 RepID=UPI0027DEC406|nr:homocysteine S-methyltransferase [Agromyces sp. ISL-38]